MTEKSKTAPVVYLVVPCYNEEEALPVTAEKLTEKMRRLCWDGKISPASRVVLVDDGSKDATWECIAALHAESPLFQGIKLSRNCGHQRALLAGLMTVRDHCDAVISMDADLQDDIDAMDGMIEKFCEGCEIVYGVRSDRKTDTVFKRGTAQAYYKMMRLMGVEMVYNHADYRLMSSRVLRELADYEEVNLFLRGLVPMLGYRTDVVYYARAPRMQGESKYPLKKMLAFAFEGITSLSIKPIRMITMLGVGIFLVSLAMLIYVLIRHFLGYTVVGWTFLAVSLWGIGGLQLLSIGIVGEYIGKIYLETKRRPRYHLETYLGDR
ncbi:MAG: glycosyltransferase family 2 protein [Oscillospiraceae bacterium]|nr:glycosyltransferase family 2 protein [Oscillospiraceae bacterium]